MDFFLQYWVFVEFGIVILVLSIVIAKLWHKIKERNKEGRQPLPETLGGKAVYFLKYIFRLTGVGLGTLLLLTIIIMLERSILSTYVETAPAPGNVEIPPGLGFEVEEAAFESEDGITLAGWYAPSQNGSTIILLHGYGGNRTGMIWHARQLVGAGYGVLMYDERASGESGGTYRSYGWEDPRDVFGAIQYISSRNENIGIAGCSIGANIALYSAALYPELGAVWADGAASVRAQDMPPPTDPVIALFIAGNYTLDWVYTIKLGIEAPTPLTDIIDEIAPRPITLVGGGTQRPLLGSESSRYTLRYAKIAGDNAQAWIIPEATHCDGPYVRPEEYSKRMIEFFNSAFEIEN